MPPELSRYFNGKKYILYRNTKTKGEAILIARRCRVQIECNARVTPFKKGYAVWIVRIKA